MKETPTALKYFKEYYDLGDERTLERLAYKIQADQKQTKSRPKEQTIPTILAQLKKWSSAHNWQERLKEYEREQLKEKLRKHNKAIEDMNERQAQLGVSLQAQGFKQASELLKQGQVDASEAIRMIKVGTDLERVARGVPTEQVAITGRIEQELIVETHWGRGTDPRKQHDASPEPTQSEDEPEISVEFGGSDT